MAGTLVPTLVLPLLLIAFIVLRIVMQVSFPIERGLIFPMALVPALWGVWNVLWELSHERTRLPVGVHGAFLPLLMMPVGAAIATQGGLLKLGPNSATWFNAGQCALCAGRCIFGSRNYCVLSGLGSTLSDLYNRVLGIA